jgi:hypothetical protein
MAFYTRDLETPIGKIENIKVPRTIEKNFKSVIYELTVGLNL